MEDREACYSKVLDFYDMERKGQIGVEDMLQEDIYATSKKCWYLNLDVNWRQSRNSLMYSNFSWFEKSYLRNVCDKGL
ncbi:unnamed protein product [Paramecium sonneborni]|uniref:Uncharacterized protein n=1 Tax=Paramecium sonneborni TaxID=65129 RepID=A0A8S1RTK1_9CILI|nr:unnamed protein product [Paramecium sonneborni]